MSRWFESIKSADKYIYTLKKSYNNFALNITDFLTGKKLP